MPGVAPNHSDPGSPLHRDNRDAEASAKRTGTNRPGDRQRLRPPGNVSRCTFMTRLADGLGVDIPESTAWAGAV